MRITLDPGAVAEDLPSLEGVAGDPRMRPIGLVGGFLLVLLGALLQIAGGAVFWNTVVAGVFVFVGVPLFSVGLAAPEPEQSLFRLGIDLSDGQRRIVTLGSLLLVSSPILVAVLGAVAGFVDWVWLTGAGLTLFGAAFILTGFIAWTSAVVSEPSAPSR